MRMNLPGRDIIPPSNHGSDIIPFARQRVVTPPPALSPDPAEDLPRNTVLTLPNITRYAVNSAYTCHQLLLYPLCFRSRRVVRLGETHCSCCHPERETTLALGRILELGTNGSTASQTPLIQLECTVMYLSKLPPPLLVIFVPPQSIGCPPY